LACGYARAGAGFCDGVFLAHAHRAASSRDDAGLREIAELAAAFAPSRERHLETRRRDARHRHRARGMELQRLDQMVSYCDGATVYPIAVGVVSAAHTIPLAPTMQAFLHALTSNWISAGARLIPLGQTDSQRVLALLEPTVVSTANRAVRHRSTISAARLFARSRQHAARDGSTRDCSGHEGRDALHK